MKCVKLLQVVKVNSSTETDVAVEVGGFEDSTPASQYFHSFVLKKKIGQS